MKICPTCQQKYSDSLEFCMQDGTVLALLPDPNATLRFDSRPTQTDKPKPQSTMRLGTIAIAGVLLLVLTVVVGAVVVYLVASPTRNSVAANPLTNSSAGNPNERSTGNGEPTKDDIARKIEQLNDEIGFSLVNSDVEKLDRQLADDYIYENDLGLKLNKSQLLNLLRTGNLHYDFVTSSNAKVDVDNALTRAVLKAQAQTRGQLQHQPFNYTFLYTNTYEKRNAGWQLVSERAWYR